MLTLKFEKGEADGVYRIVSSPDASLSKLSNSSVLPDPKVLTSSCRMILKSLDIGFLPLEKFI